MTPIKRRKTIGIDIKQASIYQYPFDDGRSDRLALRLHELDREYQLELIHLKKVARKARHELMNRLT